MSAELGQTNYSQIVAEAQNKVKELLGLINVDGTSEAGAKETKGTGYSGPNIGNLLNGSANNIATIVEGSDQQKANAIQDIMSDLMDLFSSLGTGASSKARKEVKTNDKKIEENKKTAEETSRKVNEKVQEILNNCETSSANIAEALALIEELGGDKGQIAELKAKVNEQVDIIEANKEILTSSDKSSEEKKNALVNILNASKAISELTEVVDGLKEQIEAQNAIVEDNSAKIAELTTNSAEVISDGVNKMQESLVNAGVLTQEQATLSIKSAKQTATGTAQEATGQAMTNFWATASQGAKYILSGNDKLSAGATLMQGATQGLSKLTGSIGEMGQYLTQFTEFGNGLGSFIEGAAQLIGQYDATVSPMIQSIGSWENVTAGLGELNSLVTTDLSNLGYEVDNEGNIEKANSNNNNGSNSDNNTQENSPANVELETPKFDVQKLRTFGI